MKWAMKNSKQKFYSIIILVLCSVVVFPLSSNAAIAPQDAGYANAVCSTAGLSNKQYDTSECTTDSKCSASSSCVDASPLAGVNRISSPFGYRYHPIDGQWKGHKGVDYAATAGTPIYAAVDGCITSKRYQYNASSGTGYGNMIDLKADNPAGTTVRYAHMSCFADTLTADSSGKICVKKGTIIGFVGNTGGSTGAHLHYEIQKNGTAIDPLDESSSDVMCTVDETIKKMDENAKAGGNGSTGEAYGTGTPQTPGRVGYIDAPEQDGYSDKDCLPRRFREKYKTCIFCNLFRAAFVTASNIAAASFSTLAPWILKVMSIAFALLMAMQAIRFVSSMERKDVPTLLRPLMSQTFVFIIAYILLSGSSNQFLQLAMEPMFNTGFKLAQLVMQGDVANCGDNFGISSSLSEGGLPASMGISILCTLQVIQDKLLDVITMGSAAICVSLFIKNFFIFPHPAYLLSGVGLWVVGMLLLIIFPFLMLDAVLNLAVSCALLPAAIAAYVFKATKKYVQKIWESFLKAMFSFVFLTIIMMILITVIDNTIGEATQSINKFNDEGGVLDIILNDLSWTGVLFLKIVFVCLLGWAVLGEIAEFAKSFASSVASTNIGSLLGTLGVSGAKNATQRIVAPAAKAIGKQVGRGISEKAEQVGNSVGNFISNSGSSLGSFVKANKFLSGKYKNKSGYSEITDDDGNTTYSYEDSSFLGGSKVNRSVTIDKSKRIVAENSSTTTTQNDKEKTVTNKNGIEIKSVRDKDGNEVQRSISIKDKNLQEMVTSDGKINIDAVTALRSNSGLSQQEADEVILMRVMEQRMPDEMKKIGIAEMETQGTIVRHQDGSLSLIKKEKGGTIHEFALRVDSNSGQVITQYKWRKKPDDKGNVKVGEISSNGVFNSVVTTTFDKDGALIKGGKKRFGISRFYKEKNQKNNNGPAINYKGELQRGMPDASVAFVGMSKDDIDGLKKQYKEKPYDAQNEEFDDTLSRPMFGKLSNFMKKHGRAVLNIDNEYQGLSPEEIEEIKRRRAEGLE